MRGEMTGLMKEGGGGANAAPRGGKEDSQFFWERETPTTNDLSRGTREMGAERGIREFLDRMAEEKEGS